jgi:two-component system, cell cycle response regulator
VSGRGGDFGDTARKDGRRHGGPQSGTFAVIASNAVTTPKRPAEDPMGSTMRLDGPGELRAQVLQAVRAKRRPALLVLTGNEVGTRCPLEGTTLIGRDPQSALVLSDAGVSFRHARVEDRGDAWAVVDLASTNGTKVGGELISERILSPGDRVTFGATIVRFEVQDALDQEYDDVLDRLLNIDELSGLYVRRKFDRELKTLIDAARLAGTAVGLLVMDLDGVKKINDAHGHLFGAYVIGESGRVIGAVLGDRGIASRFGGDEFVAAMIDADLAQTEVMGEEIRAAINAHAFAYEGVPLHPGISVGVASLPENASDADALFREGDAALYRAKQAGKNRVSR